MKTMSETPEQMPDNATDRPLVTFALFAYNQEDYIREAVKGRSRRLTSHWRSFFRTIAHATGPLRSCRRWQKPMRGRIKSS